ncbi:hypothetical protein CSKR_101176 [Clonorchis sinensis]|uniref:Uncharacterized protein n=1 Tax=Clonorchis sinensis TaxID=79923 RepID=A0A3R7FN03_CLOSI|nr:hypothetical protein CSKR_101176 [Clonorchis sinensis]
MVKFQPTVQQVGMNVSWSQLGSIGEFVVFAVNGTSGRGHGREKEWNSCGSAIELGMAVPCHHWPDMLQFLDSPAGRGNKVERSRYGIAGFFWDPVVEHHRPGGVGNSQPGPPNQALPKFEAWEDEGMRGQFFSSSVVYGVARYKTQPRRAQHQQQQTQVSGQAQNHRRWAMHPCYWRGDGYTNAPWCNVTERPSLQGVPVHHTRFSSLVHATRSARWKTNQAVINADNFWDIALLIVFARWFGGVADSTHRDRCSVIITIYCFLLIATGKGPMKSTDYDSPISDTGFVSIAYKTSHKLASNFSFRVIMPSTEANLLVTRFMPKQCHRTPSELCLGFIYPHASFPNMLKYGLQVNCCSGFVHDDIVSVHGIILLSLRKTKHQVPECERCSRQTKRHPSKLILNAPNRERRFRPVDGYGNAVLPVARKAILVAPARLDASPIFRLDGHKPFGELVRLSLQALHRLIIAPLLRLQRGKNCRRATPSSPGKARSNDCCRLARNTVESHPGRFEQPHSPLEVGRCVKLRCKSFLHSDSFHPPRALFSRIQGRIRQASEEGLQCRQLTPVAPPVRPPPQSFRNPPIRSAHPHPQTAVVTGSASVFWLRNKTYKQLDRKVDVPYARCFEKLNVLMGLLELSWIFVDCHATVNEHCKTAPQVP